MRQERRAVLIAALSGRALAQSARRAGYVPLVVDFFADEDTCAVAERYERLPGDMARGFEKPSLIAALDRLAGEEAILGFVYGTGFEDRPELVREIAGRWRLFGNPPDVLAQAKEPSAFAALCRASGIAHPQITWERPAEGSGWLVRQRGGAGGSHVVPLEGSVEGDTLNRYYQRRAEGRPISALFLADGRCCRVLGFSEQWALPAPGAPFRYGGAAGPASLPALLAQALSGALTRFVHKLPLVGLNSADFLVEKDTFHLLEINPRPSASWDLFEAAISDQPSLFALHLAGCEGQMPAFSLEPKARACAVVYAERDMSVPATFVWPAWTADRQSRGTSVAAGAPFCTVTAAAATLDEAKRMLAARSASIITMAYGRVE